MTKSTWGAAALLLATFVVGALSGGAAVALGDRGQERRPRSPEGYVARLAESLELTPVQQDSVRAILDRYRPRMDSLWQGIKAQHETLRTNVRSEIRAQLTPDQQTKYDEFIQRQQAERRRQGSPNAK